MRKRLIKYFLPVAFLIACGSLAWYYLHRPPLMERTEIYRGVYLTVDEIPKSPYGSGRIMIVEIHWDTPGIRLQNRPFSYPPRPYNPSSPSGPSSPFSPLSPHYRLANADWALWREGTQVLINTTMYGPSDYWRSIPGMPVRSHETVVVDGVPSHVHEHSYLLYWDRSMRAHLSHHKPPDEKSLREAVLGIGIQGISVSEGEVRMRAMGGDDRVMARSFVGFDPTRNIVWLMAFENASGYAMVQRALEEGVMFGGMMDSGGSVQLLIGDDAKGVRSHAGIRHWRPLGGYLMVRAEPLD